MVRIRVKTIFKNIKNAKTHVSNIKNVKMKLLSALFFTMVNYYYFFFRQRSGPSENPI